MNWFSNSACLFTQQYNASNRPWTADNFAEQKMHPSTQQNSGLKMSMNILRLDEQHRLPYNKRSLETSRWRPYSFREQCREKSIVFTPPLLPPSWIFVSSSPAHAMSL
ncbi:hypothetical protein TNCT_361391 [Trichonephila clavata]|uniref:Uncharacterized protein n=1 Tax=Trichonephila clavata TaxID=2740835 RepID=A0A8X6FKX9_TRICU|nr:hypothetical protein TNCT_361391 [Trichonephila clavata]